MYQGTKSELKVGEVSVNDGIHVHGVMVVPKQTRLKERLDLHFLRKSKLYVRGKIYRIHAEPITSQAAFVTDYGGKAVKRRRFSTDHVLILPRTVAELPAKTFDQPGNKEARVIKDIQSSMNVSEVVAESIYVSRMLHKSARH
jgi:tRNA(Leu) C34 or U34 (ribose-2'-O)-methylase TrmL